MASAKNTLPYQTHDLDSEATIQAAINSVHSNAVSNFAIYFDRSAAVCAFNLDSSSLAEWDNNHDATCGTRWINIWTTQDQRPLVDYLAKKYDISLRLLAFLCPQSMHAAQSTNACMQKAADLTYCVPSEERSSLSDDDDVEKLAGVRQQYDNTAAPNISSLESLGVADIVSNMWHFCTIDWGHQYVYIGINALSVVPGLEHDPDSDKPAGQRLWTSLILCSDGTVISTCERPAIHPDKVLTSICNKAGRRHVCNIFRHISRAQTQHSSQSSGLNVVKIRPDPDPVTATQTDRSSSMEIKEWSSLLFYYLFDDWMTTYALIARKEHRYRHDLEQLRQDMIKSPDVSLLERLHSLGRQLTVLKLMYQSYAQVVSRLIDRHNKMANRHNDHNSPRLEEDLQLSAHCNHVSECFPSIPEASRYLGHSHHNKCATNRFPTTTNIQLSLLSVVRFERLLDRIHLYALNEIEQCLDEKESLVFMTFNLLALSESRSIEKLTRTTIVLAKATILFLPVSLLTAYFSIQVGNIGQMYSLKTYWISFGVVTMLSIGFMLLFSMKTGTLEGESFYRNVHQLLWQKATHCITRQRKTKEV